MTASIVHETVIDSSQHTITITCTASPRVWHFSAFHYYISNSLTDLYMSKQHFLSEPRNLSRHFPHPPCTTVALKNAIKTMAFLSATVVQGLHVFDVQRAEQDAQHAERQTRVNRTGPEYSINYRKCCVQQTANAQFSPRLQVVPQT